MENELLQKKRHNSSILCVRKMQSRLHKSSLFCTSDEISYESGIDSVRRRNISI